MVSPRAQTRHRLTVQGTVQGVGFRPFVYRLASELGLGGMVQNSPSGVVIEVEGASEAITRFRERLQSEKPPSCYLFEITEEDIPRKLQSTFTIRHSEQTGGKTALILPDLALCDDCRRELLDPNNRRFRYPFINCTNCGPRYSIIEALPYDRPHTTMKRFLMCEACRAEYDDPGDRRFHAQPNACPVCGPQAMLWDAQGREIALRHEAVEQAAAEILSGKIVAVKGLGGFHLVADARSDDAVARLRERKHREEKPLALMFPDMNSVRACCKVNDHEAALLQSTASPIVLLERKLGGDISSLVAPGNPYLGAMLPYTPLHVLLMQAVNGPVVATSGNLSEEPICIDEHEALQRLGGIAERYLVHNRPIARHVDDSIVRWTSEGQMMLRRARGYAPLPIRTAEPLPKLVALGGHLKNTIAVAVDKNLFVSQHIGDLETPRSMEAFRSTVRHLCSLYEHAPDTVACDLHPDYLSTQYGAEHVAEHTAGHTADRNGEVLHVQHHYAHVLSVMAEHGLKPPVMGVSWDGTGYGSDGTIWGGEFIKVTDDGFERVGCLYPFRLPGGDAAVREPRRSALGLLHELYGDDILLRGSLLTKLFDSEELRLLAGMLQRGVNSPVTSSAGRLFDGVAALAGLRGRLSFEGQAAMQLEFSCHGVDDTASYPMEVVPAESVSLKYLDWRPMLRAILSDIEANVSVATIAVKFHNALTDGIAKMVAATGLSVVALSGGCFQNVRLLENTVRRLRAEGLTVYLNHDIPPNDGGIAVGQALGAARVMRQRQRR